MAHRPYPNVDRALRQLDRGRRPEPPTEFQLRLAEQAQAALETADRLVGPVVRNFREGLSRWAETHEPGRYVLSTRRPGIVSGPA
ncbi:hypothetical protein [Streptomyces fungicidicus]|uniref:hypothetical protein n=1 Tax=Streptomyces fungicidicus TaxID=68203 RepID=UPI0038112854